MGKITSGPIDLTALLASHPAPSSDGAQLVFTGIVREQNHGRAVTGVSYEAFAPLAENVFREIAAEAAKRWVGTGVAIVHRVGRLEVGEVSVAVVVSAPHRGEAYSASRFAIDELKVRAPIWKQEHYVDGETEWLPGHELCQHSHSAHSEHAL